MAFLIRVVAPSKKFLMTDSPTDLPLDSDVPSPPAELSMEQALRLVLDEESIANDTWSNTRTGILFQVDFTVVTEEKMERILDRLAYYNFGKTQDSSIMVIEPTAFMQKREQKRNSKTGGVSQDVLQSFLRSLKSRLCVAQVYSEIQQRGNFDMNYLCFLLCASVIADIALVTNSAGVVFASMLLSPLMDPIMCILFGLTLRETRMLVKGIRNTTISLLLCIVIGLTFGYAAHSISTFEQIAPYPTSEMSQRGRAKSLIASTLVAGFSGISVAFAILNRRVAALIGNAISLSLLPPAVNCGQLLLLFFLALAEDPVMTPIIKAGIMMNTSLGNLTTTAAPVIPMVCNYPWIREYEFVYVKNACHAAKEFALLSMFSFILVTMNIILILITGYTVNKLKDMAPRAFMNETVRRFYQKDIPEVRGNYDCLHKLDAGELASYAYKEYLRLNDIPSDQVSDVDESDKLGSKFLHMIEGVGHDPHLKTISHATGAEDYQYMRSFLTRSKALAYKEEYNNNDIDFDGPYDNQTSPRRRLRTTSLTETQFNGRPTFFTHRLKAIDEPSINGEDTMLRSNILSREFIRIPPPLKNGEFHTSN